MKTSLFFSGILASLLVLISSCQKDSLDTTRKLELDTEPVVHLEAGDSEKIITVRATHREWTAEAYATWLTVRKIGNNLVINAESNETLEPRQAKIKVFSADITQTLEVKQAGYPTLLVETDPAEVIFEKNASTISIRLKTNAKNWSISNTASWITVTSDPESSIVSIKVEENRTKEIRTAHLTVHSGSLKHTILVKQRGLLHFFLPYNEWGQNFSNIRSLELARNSRLKASPNPNRSPRIPDYTFSTTSTAFPEVKYEFVDYGSRTLYATTLIGDADIVRSDAFHEYLISEGFERVSSPNQTSQLEFVNRARKTQLYIYAIRDGQSQQVRGVVFCRPLHKQPEPMPTLERLELGITRHGEATEAEVEQWEQTNKGAFDQEFSNIIGTPFFFVPEPFYGRGYFYRSGAKRSRLLDSYVHLYTRHTLGIYRFGGMDYLTNEFRQLLEREGFVFSHFSPHARAYLYQHQGKRLALAIRSMEIGRYRMLRININPLTP